MKGTIERMQEDAREVTGSPSKAAKLAESVLRLTSSGKYAGQLTALKHKILSLARMVKCYSRREYLDIPWQTILLVTAALIYVVSPLDAIADFLPVMGFTDDTAVILAVFSSVSKDVERFLAWEAAREKTPPEETGSC
ncbi:MAG: DUF1232 domain-containing protein [Chlorobiaceae bacterium]|nr:DUF1232 domain-containing protein [Chlorobiaceae bacterium]NTV59940.1 DUF1232 domain-containing protein [Chlorobiaceae bacterium]